jgi:hypothetical protein
MWLREFTKQALLNRWTMTVAVALFAATMLTTQTFALGLNNAPNGLLVSPVVEETMIGKGEILPVQMAIENPTNSTVTLKATVNDFIASSNESGTPDILLNNNSKTPLPLNNFESLVEPISNITLNPHQRLYFNVYIGVPTSAASGGYYGLIRFENVNLTNTANVGEIASTGTLFLITVPGNLIQKINLVQFAVEQNNQPTSFVNSGNLQIVTRLDNVGNIHLQPFGTIEVKSMFGKDVALVQFNGTLGNILPDSIRKFAYDLPKKHYLGHYTVTASIAWQKGSSNIINVQTGFWYVPIWVIIVIILIIALIVLTVWWLIHRRSAQRRKYRH